MYKLGLTGLSGRMSQAIINALEAGEWPLKLMGGSSRTLTASPFCPVMELEALMKASDVIIDMTLPEALADHLLTAVSCNRPLFIGITGLNPSHLELMKEASHQIPILYSPNTSLGIALLAEVIKNISTALSAQVDLDMDIIETHHRHKKDAPSGTACLLANALLDGAGLEVKEIPWYDPAGERGPRPDGKIGLSVLRSGENPGEHTVVFSWGGEALSLTHRTFDRRILAEGALRGALWLAQQEKRPGLYTMQDVLKKA